MALTLTEKIHPNKTKRRWKPKGMEYKVLGIKHSKTELVQYELNCQLRNFIIKKKEI